MNIARQNVVVSTSTGDFALTMAEFRVVADFARASAEEVLHIFEAARPDDARPRAAADAARAFVECAPRGRLQRVTSTDAHRAAREVTDEAAAQAARSLELSAGADLRVGEAALERARQRATATLVDVLRRYPAAPAGRGRVAELMSALDAELRSAHG